MAAYIKGEINKIYNKGHAKRSKVLQKGDREQGGAEERFITDIFYTLTVDDRLYFYFHISVTSTFSARLARGQYSEAEFCRRQGDTVAPCRPSSDDHFVLRSPGCDG